MARTDALAVEGLESALERAAACIEAGADMVFPEAITELEMYKLFAARVKAPIMATSSEPTAPAMSTPRSDVAAAAAVPSTTTTTLALSASLAMASVAATASTASTSAAEAVGTKRSAAKVRHFDDDRNMTVVRNSA